MKHDWKEWRVSYTEKLTPKQKEVVELMKTDNETIRMEDDTLLIWQGDVEKEINRHTFEALLRKGLIEPCAWRLKETE